MKIRAIRLREVGCFGDPIVVEGLSGGLDVLADNNEAGKSTLFRAVRTVLLEKHTTSKQEVEALRPYRGGAPLIEIDFEIGPAAYRLRKQFLSQKSALLTELASGAVKRGVDADEEVFRLIGADGSRHPYGLFWVAQEESFAPATPDERERAALAGIIQREVASITGGRRAQAVRALALENLDRLVTRQQMKPKGDYAEAVQERERLRDEIAKGQREVERAGSLFEQLASARARLTDVENPEAAAARRQAIEASSTALEAAIKAQQQADDAHMKFRLARAPFENAERKAKEMRDRLDQEHRLAEEIARVQEKLTGAEIAAKQADGTLSETLLRVDKARRELQMAETLIQQIRAVEDRSRIEAERMQLRTRLNQAKQAQGKLVAATNILSRNKLTAAILKALEAEDRDIAILRAKLTAAAPSVMVDFDPGQEGKIASPEGPLKQGMRIAIDQPTEFRIAGIGRLTAEPGAAGDMRQQSAKAQEMLEAHERKLRGLGATDLQDAVRLARERSDAESVERLAKTEIEILAEKGMDHLQNAVMALELRLAEAVPEIAATPAEGTERLAAAQRAAREAEMARDEAQAVKAAADKAHIALDARNIELRKQLSGLAGNLPSGGERAAFLAALDSDVVMTRQALDSAQATFDAMSGRVLPDEAMEGLRARKKRAIEADSNAARAKVELGETIANTQGQLSQIFESGAGEKLEGNTEHLGAIVARIARLEREVAELKLLIQTLDDCAAAARSAFFEPVVKGLKPLLSLVLPGSDVTFGEKFTPESLSRDGQLEEFERLSGGTREQIAILVRLAFARLAADAGRPAPVFLDDALVYADDNRIEKLFDALQIAAKAHQVILLTCRTKVFSPLGGNALRIERRDFT